MQPDCFIQALNSIQLSGDRVETDILAHINDHTAISLDALVTLLPQYSWSQIFHAVDRLARGGRIVLRKHKFDYTLFSYHYSS